MTAVDMTKLEPIEGIQGEDDEETEELRALALKANQFITSFSWCDGVERGYAGITIPSVLGTFLFEIKTSNPDVDRLLWVIVGDLPPAYLVVDEATNPTMALEKYIELMSEWVDAAEKGASVEDLIPVNVQATKENAEMLKKRLGFLRDRVIPEYAD